MNHLKHVAIIMDGNGRWANQRNRPRVWGHIRGSKKVSEIVEASVDLNLDALTLYAFSTENWSRPVSEIKVLFKLLFKFLLREKSSLIKNNIVFKVIGDISGLDQSTKELIQMTEKQTALNTGLKLSFAFSYGGRKEIVDAVNRFIISNPGKMIEEKDISALLYRPETLDVDLMIRTAGDQRISNFLLWQVSYGELYFTEKQWPDFSKEDYLNILREVSERQRRFGSLDSQSNFQITQKLAEQTKSQFTKGL